MTATPYQPDDDQDAQLVAELSRIVAPPPPLWLRVECRWCARPGIAVWVGATCVVRHDPPGGTCGMKTRGGRAP